MRAGDRLGERDGLSTESTAPEPHAHTNRQRRTPFTLFCFEQCLAEWSMSRYESMVGIVAVLGQNETHLPPVGDLLYHHFAANLDGTQRRLGRRPRFDLPKRKSALHARLRLRTRFRFRMRSRRMRGR
jgi:hypothetical protein